MAGACQTSIIRCVDPPPSISHAGPSAVTLLELNLLSHTSPSGRLPVLSLLAFTRNPKP